MARSYKLDHFTKGTGASVAPIDDSQQTGEVKRVNTVPVPHERRRRSARRETVSTPLAPGHVRKKTTGEIGRVVAVDARAGTATVRWMRSGVTSTVPLTSVSRR